MAKLRIILDLRTGLVHETVLFAKLVYLGGIDRSDVVPSVVAEHLLALLREARN